MNPVVEQIGQMHFEGSLIPHNWYQTDVLKLANGKPNLVAITLLADIVYWYRPTIIRDEATGKIVAVRQKFRDTRLQKNYRTWGEGFGFTLRQVEDAMAFLKAHGVITVERRAVTTDFGTLPNCAFIEPIPAMIEAISAPVVASPVITGDASPQNGRPSPVITGEGARFNGRPLPLKRETITKTTTEITPKNKTKTNPSPTLNVGPGINCVEKEGVEADKQADGQADANPYRAHSRRYQEALDREVDALVTELQDQGSEKRHRQLLCICDQHGLPELPQQALQATRRRMGQQKRRGPLDKPGAYYQQALLALLQEHQVFVPTLENKAESNPAEVRRQARQSLGLLEREDG